jgi:hypothetical protein
VERADFITTEPMNELPLGLESLALTEKNPERKETLHVLASKVMATLMDYEERLASKRQNIDDDEDIYGVSDDDKALYEQTYQSG